MALKRKMEEVSVGKMSQDGFGSRYGAYDALDDSASGPTEISDDEFIDLSANGSSPTTRDCLLPPTSPISDATPSPTLGQLGPHSLSVQEKEPKQDGQARRRARTRSRLSGEKTSGQ